MIRTVGYMLTHLMPLVSSPWLYLVVAVAVAVDGFLPVIPTEALVIGLGALTASGRPNLLALAAAVTLGGVAGDRVTYLIGRRAGGRLRHRRLVAAKAKAERALLRYGGTAILIGRFLPYGRAATAMTAGSVSMPLGRYGLFTGLASAAWAAYTIGLGRLGGATFAGSPLLGAAFGMGLGLVLGGVHFLVERLRRPAARPHLPVPVAGRERAARQHDYVGHAGPVDLVVDAARDRRRDDRVGATEPTGRPVQHRGLAAQQRGLTAQQRGLTAQQRELTARVAGPRAGRDAPTGVNPTGVSPTDLSPTGR
jgi:membrane-associated protein